jgi:hypothetical protein
MRFTQEIMTHIGPGLKDVKVSGSQSEREGISLYVRASGRDAVSLHVGRWWIPLRLPAQCPLLFRQHTSAALTVNENYDSGVLSWQTHPGS